MYCSQSRKRFVAFFFRGMGSTFTTLARETCGLATVSQRRGDVGEVGSRQRNVLEIPGSPGSDWRFHATQSILEQLRRSLRPNHVSPPDRPGASNDPGDREYLGGAADGSPAVAHTPRVPAGPLWSCFRRRASRKEHVHPLEGLG